MSACATEVAKTMDAASEKHVAEASNDAPPPVTEAEAEPTKVEASAAPESIKTPDLETAPPASNANPEVSDVTVSSAQSSVVTNQVGIPRASQVGAAPDAAAFELKPATAAPVEPVASQLSGTMTKDFRIKPEQSAHTAKPKGEEDGKDELEDEFLGGMRPPDLSPAMAKTVKELRTLQVEHEAFESEYLKEWNALKLKYLQKFRPLYSKRHQILCAKPEEASVVSQEGPPVGTVKLPDFWLIAMKNHRTLAELIRPHDEPVLKYLEDIRSEWLDDDQQTSFKLMFVFAENPYFYDEILTKTYNMEKDEDGEGVLTGTEGTKIKWKADKNVTKVTVTKKQRNLKTKQTRIVKETKTVESFFDFFNGYAFPSPEQFQLMDEEKGKEMEDEVEAEFDIGCIIREKIIPRALGWFMCEEDDEVSDTDDEDSDASDDASDDDDESD